MKEKPLGPARRQKASFMKYYSYQMADDENEDAAEGDEMKIYGQVASAHVVAAPKHSKRH